MGVIHDIYEKVRYWRHNPKVVIYAEDHAEKLNCRICGKRYISRGKYDPGICRDCEREQNAECIGGPDDGEKAHDRG